MLKKTIDNYRNFLINNIEPNIFNIEFCIFAPISSLQLKNEMLIEKNFENYFRYFFNELLRNKQYFVKGFFTNNTFEFYYCERNDDIKKFQTLIIF